MKRIPIGQSGLESSAIGLGCMGMSEFYGPADDAESLKVLDRALELGVTHFDTSNVYGRGHNESLLGAFLKGRRDRVMIASKFGVVRDPDGPPGSTYDRDLDNSPAYMRRCLEESLGRLGTDHLDLYYIHRLDPKIPVEDTVGEMGKLVEEGKIRAIGLSEVDAETLRRAHGAYPVSALQSEYSLWERDAELEVLPACRDLGITFVPYSPLGRGFLTGAIKATDGLAENDLRKSAPRFQAGNIDRNLELLDRIKDLAAAHDCTLGQIAIAWILAQEPPMVPIPGTKRLKYLEKNVGAADVALSAEEVRHLGEILAPEAIAGSRHWVASGGPGQG
jgi:aryl-alcohol dehydrogenase-like predicted oxidoreductase